MNEDSKEGNGLVTPGNNLVDLDGKAFEQNLQEVRPAATDEERSRVLDFIAGALGNLTDVLGERVDYVLILAHPKQVDKSGTELRVEMVSCLPPTVATSIVTAWLRGVNDPNVTKEKI